MSLSAFSFVLSIAITVFAHEIVGLSEELAFAIALIVTSVINFLALRYYVYPDSKLSYRNQLTGFVCSAVAFRLFDYSAFLLLHSALSVPYTIASISVLCVAYVAKQLVHRWIVFKPSNTAKT